MSRRSGRTERPRRRLAALAALVGAVAGCSSPAPQPEQTGLAPAPPTHAPGTIASQLPEGATRGPLRVGDGQGRYLTDRDGTPVLLTGAHTWLNLVDLGETKDSVAGVDFPRYLDYLAAAGHNVVRLWAWEQAWGASWTDGPSVFAPLPYLRTGPGTAGDGQPTFDLERFDDAYFDRLRSRTEAAGQRGIWVSVMLFNGFSVNDKGRGMGNPCLGHPFAAGNNVNGISADRDRDGRCDELHRLDDPAVTALQRRYVRRVVEAVGDLDNVLFEISNESEPDSTDWQAEMIRTVRAAERDGPMQHPVGMTAQYPDGDDADLFASAADWVSPRGQQYVDDPPVADGTKVVLLDTDHLFGVGGDERWLWRSVTRGHNVLYMDCYDNPFTECDAHRADPTRELTIANMGYARRVLAELDLRATEPVPEAASSGFALRDSSSGSLVVYLPGGPVEVRLAAGPYQTCWLNPADGALSPGEPVDGGGARTLTSPFADQAVLLAKAGSADGCAALSSPR